MSKILFLGDFFYNYNYISQDIDNISSWILNEKVSSVINLEGPIDEDFSGKVCKRGPNLASTLTSVIALKKMNCMGVTLANNHFMDFGINGMKKTIEVLEQNNISHSGAGNNLFESIKPMEFLLNNKKIAIYSFGWDVEETIYSDENTPGCAPRDKNVILKVIKENRNYYDLIICEMHWGFEYNRYPMPYDISLAHNMIDAGADLIIGHHPHCVQPFEVYKGKKIYYSLGNFYFSGVRNSFDTLFNEKIQNQSDYGIGVVFDIQTMDTEPVLVFYNKELQETIISPKSTILNEILFDITNTDYLSKKYLKKCQKNKKNFNPILGINENKNLKQIKFLFLIYKIKRIIKRMLKK